MKIRVLLTAEIEIIDLLPPTSFLGKLLRLKKRVKKYVSGTFEFITNGEAHVGCTLVFPVWNTEHPKKFKIEDWVLHLGPEPVAEIPLYCRTSGFNRDCFSFKDAKLDFQNSIVPRLKKHGFTLLSDTIKLLDKPSKKVDNSFC